MSARTAGNFLVLQGGGPTAVLNTTLFAAIDEALPRYQRVIGACFGIEGLVRRALVDLSALGRDELLRLKASPGAALGSTRYKPSDAQLQAILDVLRDFDVRGLIVIGGNGSLRGAQAIADAVAHDGFECSVIGVPKTIDNDIPATDRCPGFASAARYVAQSVRDLGMDVRALPQPVSLFETMGRSVGWLAGASALARLDEDHAPHLIYVPERPFSIERFLGDIDRAVTRRGWAVAVMTEGLRSADGRQVYETGQASQADALGRALPGGVAAYLADIVTARLKIRCRWEKPGLCGRASMLHVSPQDQKDAELVGRAGVGAAIAGHTAQMIALRSLSEQNGEGVEIVPLSRAAGERAVPHHWLDDSELAVTPAFLEYVRPIVGSLVEYAVPLKDQLPPLSATRERHAL